MKALMGQEYEALAKSYEEKRTQGLRINTLKIDVNSFLRINPFHLESVPWCPEGFYYEEGDRPGKHPYHEAGLYYIQEPSAMAVGTILDPKPGDRVLDLCAAPGGKSTHIAAMLQGKGLLVSNEIHPVRAKILSQNVERMGIRNCIVTNEEPQHLAQRFIAYFDKILVDAPCSGEGMFRKDPDACQEWSMENVAACAVRQIEILSFAAKMLRPQGQLVYSTCTFSPDENERVIEQFLREHKELSLVKVKAYEGFESGRVEWTAEGSQSLKKALRLWPHRLRGEGHFLAVLEKHDGELPKKNKGKVKSLDKNSMQDYFDFGKNYLQQVPEGTFIQFGENLYDLPELEVSLEQLRVLRPGWHLGTLKKNRFEPSHALALSLNASEARQIISLPAESKEMNAYLKGETIEANGMDGWNLVCVEGYSIGWGKLVKSILKNHYPKGLRW
ncbi:NOL1/NOP2/sun family putative RNA methylase [Geosporobacter subterraneus DSM 17957]|uniref:NOL1/NOP2/sun family putative RNA methylase n=2 Tax=Geosporobacter TaxID=390805 RepID=A0A1M6IJP6_9FIRM|nr:NOL1/NOP2/sun family putative RNA methylase [Geosporobacter subterraneus DSM 17957]